MYDLWVYAIQISVWITRIYTYIKNLMHSYTHTLIHSYIHTLIHSYTRTLIHSYTHIHTHTYTQTHNLACTHTSTRPHSLQTHTRTHTRAHTYTHNTVDTSRLRLTYKWGESLLKSWRVLENSVWFWIRTTWQCSQTRDCHPETAATHCNNTLQQHSATTHCNNTLQQHSATTLHHMVSNTYLHPFAFCIEYTHTHSQTHTHTHTHTQTHRPKGFPIWIPDMSQERELGQLRYELHSATTHRATLQQMFGFRCQRVYTYKWTGTKDELFEIGTVRIRCSVVSVLLQFVAVLWNQKFRSIPVRFSI